MTSSDWQHKINGANNRHDCKFLVGHENDQKQIAAHKSILASASPVFKAMFYGHLPEKDKPIPIPEVRPNSFKIMLEYIYTKKLNIKSLEKYACGLYYLADKYMLPDLAKRCIEFLTNHINAKNVCLLYEFANLFSLKTLKERCMQVLIYDTQNVLQYPNFLDISMGTLMVILDQNTLNISELDLFYALERFAEKRVIFENYQNSKEDSASDISNDEINISFYDDFLVVCDDESSYPKPGLIRIRSHQCINDFLDACDDESSYPKPGLIRIRSHQCVNSTGLNYFYQSPNITVITTTPSLGYVPQRAVPSVLCDRVHSFVRGSTHGKQNSSAQEITVTRRNPTIKKEEFRCAVKKIRFLTMTPHEFGKGPANSKLLKENEILTFFKIICNPHNNEVPVPQGFSNSRTKRNANQFCQSFNNTLLSRWS